MCYLLFRIVFVFIVSYLITSHLILFRENSYSCCFVSNICSSCFVYCISLLLFIFIFTYFYFILFHFISPFWCWAQGPSQPRVGPRSKPKYCLFTSPIGTSRLRPILLPLLACCPEPRHALSNRKAQWP